MTKTFDQLVRDYKGKKREDETWNGLKVLVMGANTGTIYVNAGGDLPHDPASLNKLMVFYIAQRAIKQGLIDLDDTITVSAKAAGVQYSKVERGDRMSMRTALSAMMINSDNGVTAAIAEELNKALGLKSLVGHMNKTADRLGMKDTNYSNTHGLPGSNSTTAYDIALLTRQIAKEFPAAADKFMSNDSVTYDGQFFKAHHKLNRPGAEQQSEFEVSAKTGFTFAARHNISAIVTAPDGRELIIVVMGANWTDQRKLDRMGLPMRGSSDVKGNNVRDELVQQLAQEFLPKPRRRKVAMSSESAIADLPEEVLAQSTALAHRLIADVDSQNTNQSQAESQIPPKAKSRDARFV